MPSFDIVNRVDLQVAHALLDEIVVAVAVAAEDLHGVGADLHGRVRGEGLGNGALLGVLDAVVGHPSWPVR